MIKTILCFRREAEERYLKHISIFHLFLDNKITYDDWKKEKDKFFAIKEFWHTGETLDGIRDKQIKCIYCGKGVPIDGGNNSSINTVIKTKEM